MSDWTLYTWRHREAWALRRRFDPAERRDSHGRWVRDPVAQAVVDKAVYDVGDDIDKAARLLAQGKRVELNQPDQVSTLVKKLGEVAAEMQKQGKDAPNFDLCKVTVKHTNLFCLESKGIPRIQMPQLTGQPLPGTPGSKLPRDARGEVDLNPELLAELKRMHVKTKSEIVSASHLRATQSELNGVKVAGIMDFLQSGKPGSQIDEPLFVSRDNYIVDGHHRWAALVGLDVKDNHLGDVKVPVIKVDMDIGTLLRISNKLAKHYGMPQQAAKGNNQLLAKKLIEYDK